MAKQKSTTTIRSGNIGSLAKERDGIISAAEAEDGRDLTDNEQARVHALNSVLAYTEARSVSDAAVLVGVALEQIELARDGGGTQEGIEMAYAALRSARDVLAKAA